MDPFEVLGLAPDAPLDDAEEAYRRLLLIHHPDLHHDAGPTRLAVAEHATRELNGAIAQLRTAPRPSVLAGAPARPSATPSAATGPDVASSSTDCPMCGARFHRSVDLRVHVAVVHDIRVDRRLRPPDVRRRRRRSRHPLIGLAFHSPWALLPVNALASTVLALAVGGLTHDVVLARWTFAVGMAPTVMRVLTGAAD